MFFNHPGFIEPMIERVRAALEQIPADRRAAARLIFTAHSIPHGDGRQLPLRGPTRRRQPAGVREPWAHANYRTGLSKPQRPAAAALARARHWRRAQRVHAAGQTRDVVIVPIGFLSDHIEILYDLDTEARGLCEQFGLNMVRAATVGTHPQFVTMIRELIEERIAERTAARIGHTRSKPR